MSDTLFQGATISTTPEPESPAVAFFEMQNTGGTATMHITLRCKNGEDELEFMNRVNNFIVVIDPTADVQWKLKDAPKGYSKFGGSGSGGQKRTEIKDGKFVVKQVMRYERANKKSTADDPKPNWSYLRAFGEQDGQEVSADCFVGNPEWQPDNAASKSGMFPNFFSWKVDDKKSIPAGTTLVAKVTMNPQYKTYEISAFENGSASGM